MLHNLILNHIFVKVCTDTVNIFKCHIPHFDCWDLKVLVVAETPIYCIYCTHNITLKRIATFLLVVDV